MILKNNLTTKIFFGLGLGLLVGLLLTSNPTIATNYIKPFGDVFLKLVKMIIVPLVLSSLVVGAASTGDVKKLGRIGVKSLVYFMITTTVAIAIGLILSNVLNPGNGLSIPMDATVEAQEAPSLIETLLNMVPENPIKAMSEANMLQIIIFALFLGISITVIGEKGQPVYKFFDSLAEISYKIVEIIMGYAPIGVFALIAPVVAENGPSVFLPLLKVIATMYVAAIVHSIIVYPICLSFVGINPLKFFKDISSVILLAFTTSSSSGTLPVSMDVAENKLGVSKSISSFVLPLGATINMNGTAIYQGVCALFIAQVYGIELTISQQLVIILTATLAAIGTAGVPGSGLIMLTMTLQSVGLPIEGIALIAGIDRILDMARTTLNVTGDIVGAVMIAKTEGELRQPSPMVSYQHNS